MDLKNLCILPENSAEGLRSRRDCCWSHAVSVFKNTPKNVVVQAKVQLEHSSHMVWVSVEATCLHVNPWYILKEMTKLCYWNYDILERVLKWIILFNSIRGKWAPMQVIKQQEHVKTVTTEEQKWSFGGAMIIS